VPYRKKIQAPFWVNVGSISLLVLEFVIVQKKFRHDKPFVPLGVTVYVSPPGGRHLVLHGSNAIFV